MKGDSNFKDRGRGKNQRGQRGGYQGRGSEKKNQGESKFTEQASDNSSRGGYNRGRSNQGGSSRGRASGRSNSYFASMKCYNCGHLGHPSYRCLEKPSSSNQDKRMAYVKEDCIYSVSYKRSSLWTS